MSLDSAASQGEAVIELVDVTKTYPVEPPVLALRGVSLRVEQGELVGIVGPSGSGKTTLLHLIGTLDRPTSGTVRVAGYDVAKLSDRELSALRAGRVGFVFQQFFLAEHQSVLDNVADGLLYAGPSLVERRQAAREALCRVGLADKLGVRPTQMSGGQRQRVAIARALVGNPAIVLADEPTGNLDQATGQSILDLFVELNAEGTTILLITHDLAIASRMARVVRVLDGLVIDDTTQHRGAGLFGSTSQVRGGSVAGGGSSPAPAVSGAFPAPAPAPGNSARLGDGVGPALGGAAGCDAAGGGAAWGGAAGVDAAGVDSAGGGAAGGGGARGGAALEGPALGGAELEGPAAVLGLRVEGWRQMMQLSRRPARGTTGGLSKAERRLSREP